MQYPETRERIKIGVRKPKTKSGATLYQSGSGRFETTSLLPFQQSPGSFKEPGCLLSHFLNVSFMRKAIVNPASKGNNATIPIAQEMFNTSARIPAIKAPNA
ncbi:hypothetical protein CLV36_101152 [Laceyella sediminis]|jgi:hypothetical protein|uniref:Uncharacterized protein n=1 Tax=Laceyella sediminis TaxID=573074 RepID=A0ABX5ESW6_9BACL|nr:hypothetical protein CLV36_101152 [Laceyella sediminis]